MNLFCKKFRNSGKNHVVKKWMIRMKKGWMDAGRLLRLEDGRKGKKVRKLDDRKGKGRGRSEVGGRRAREDGRLTSGA